MDMLMDTAAPTPAHESPRTKALWAARITSAIPILFMLMDCVGKFLQPDQVVQGTVSLGYPASTILGIGIVELVCTLLYIVPRTAVLGAVLLTGYLGGAIATHVRVGNPVFSHILFPTYVAAFIWGGLLLRDRRLRALMPFRSDVD